MQHVSIAAVAFDLDGLMFNTETLYFEVGDELLRRRGKRLTQELLDQMMGRPGRVSLQTMIDFHALTDTVSGLQQETDEIFSALLPHKLQPMPGLMNLLQALEDAGIPKAIATSSRRIFLDKLLTPFQLAPRFAFFLTAEDVEHGKPHPEIYRKAAERFGVHPSQMLVLEDSAAGCQSAAAAGAYAVAVPGDHSRHHCFDGAALRGETLADHAIYQLLGLA